MSADNAVSILICRDAGSAGRMLLQRHDLRVRWALTPAEVAAVIKLTKCAVCITRDSLAKHTLVSAAKADRPIATIVLLEPEQWSSWREYFEAGATSVLQATATEQLLDAMSDATGLSFRNSPRVPFKNEVKFALGAEGGSWRSLNLSSTGIAIMDFPPYALGSEVDLAFDLHNKRFEFNAVVSQILRVGQRRAVGLEFREVTPELQMNLDEIIQGELKRIRPTTEPVEDFDEALDEGTLLALRNSNVQRDALTLMRVLTSGGTVASADAAAPWLVAACESLSSIEVAAVRNPNSAPKWAQEAVAARLRVYQIRANAGSNIPPEAEIREVFAFCQRLAETAEGADEASLVQVTNIRADLLHALYDPDLIENMNLPGL
jgi:hypothetical protein